MQRSGKKTSTAVREPDVEGLPVVRPNVAAIDLASEIHWVCAPSIDRSGREVEQFGATTPELERMAEWLKERKVESVAMEGVLDRAARSFGAAWVGNPAGEYARIGARARAEEVGPRGLQVGAAITQLRAIGGFLSTE